MAASLHDSVVWVRHHPYATAGAVFIGGAILIYLYYSGGSAQAAPAAGSPQSDYLMAQLQSEATQAQYGAQLGAIAAQEQTAAVQVQGAVAIDKSRNETQLGIAGLQAGVLLSRTDAERAEALATTAAGLSLGLSQTEAARTLGLSQTEAARTIGLAQQSTAQAHDSLLYGFMNGQTAAQLQAITAGLNERLAEATLASTAAPAAAAAAAAPVQPWSQPGVFYTADNWNQYQNLLMARQFDAARVVPFASNVSVPSGPGAPA